MVGIRHGSLRGSWLFFPRFAFVTFFVGSWQKCFRSLSPGVCPTSRF